MTDDEVLFEDLRAPDAPAEPPPDALTVALPAGTDFAAGAQEIERQVAADPELRPWIAVAIGTSRPVVTSREHLRRVYGMGIPLTSGAAGSAEGVGGSPSMAQPQLRSYACPMAECGQQQTILVGDPPSCPVHGTPMTEA